MLQPGTLLKCLSTDVDDYFFGSRILLTEYNEKGAIGFITNRLFHRKLNALLEFASLPGYPLYEGGPVDQEHLFFTHTRPDIISGGTLMGKEQYVGGDFTQLTAAIAAGRLTATDLQIFVGYCGWDAGDLEVELSQGEWGVVKE